MAKDCRCCTGLSPAEMTRLHACMRMPDQDTHQAEADAVDEEDGRAVACGAAGPWRQLP